MRVLISDKLAKEGIEVLKQENDIAVDVKTDLSAEQLLKEIDQYDGIIIRSATKLTADVLEHAENLKAIARAGVGVDNIDVPAATKKGIIVMNTPAGNTIAVAEHTLALMLALARSVPQANASMKEGKWEKKKYMGTQLAGKTLGVIGLGRVGCEVAKRARIMDMEVIAYDPFISEQRASQLQIDLCKELDDLLKRSDYISIHTSLTDDTRNLLCKEKFNLMKDGVRIVNCARGGIVNEEDLYDATVSGKVAGAAMDVFEQEPPACRKLVELEQVVCTPHLGASTAEAQVRVAVDAAQQLSDTLLGRGIAHAINMPSMDPRAAERLKPYLNLARQMGSLQMQLLRGQIHSLRITYSGEVLHDDTGPITTSLLIGLLRPVVGGEINFVNAMIIAEERGIEVSQTRSRAHEDFSTLISATVQSDNTERSVAGTLFGNNDPRIVRIDNYDVEAIPQGNMLMIFDQDCPGLIGSIGTILGDEGVNIARMTFGREKPGGPAITVLNLDAKPSASVIEAIKKARKGATVYSVSL